MLGELIKREDGPVALPLEYKCHTFSDEVVAVQVLERWSRAESRNRYYTPQWQPIPDPISTFVPSDGQLRDPPACLERMLDLAATLGAELGTYMRIDFFVAERGCVFNEFSSMPLLGRDYTPYGEELFGSVWAKKCPNAT